MRIGAKTMQNDASECEVHVQASHALSLLSQLRLIETEFALPLLLPEHFGRELQLRGNEDRQQGDIFRVRSSAADPAERMTGDARALVVHRAETVVVD